MQGNNHKVNATISSTKPSTQKHDCITLEVKSLESGRDIDVIISAKKSVLENVFPQSIDSLNNAITHWEMSNGFVFGFSLKGNFGLTSMEVFQRLIDHSFQASCSPAVMHIAGSLSRVYFMARARDAEAEVGAVS